MIDFKIADGSKSGVLKLCGSLTIQTALELKNAVSDALSKVEELSIDHSEAEEFDITYIQILEAAFKTAGSAGKKVTIETGCEKFEMILKDSGFSENFVFAIEGNQR